MKIIHIDDTPFHQLAYRSSGRQGIPRVMQLPFYKARVTALPEGLEAIVAVSDLQGREKDQRHNRLVGEAVAEELALLTELNEIPSIGCVLLAGDLYDYPDCRKMGGTGDVTSVWNAFASISPQVIGVHGNHDTVHEQSLVAHVSILDGHVQAMGNMQVGGVSGIIGREDKNQRKSKQQFIAALQSALKDITQVLLLHQGPNDPYLQQKGEPLIRDFLEHQGSALVIFGHCHWSTPLIDIGANQVLNVDQRLFVMTT